MAQLFWKCKVWVGEDALYRSIYDGYPNFTVMHWVYGDLLKKRDHYLKGIIDKGTTYYYEIEAVP